MAAEFRRAAPPSLYLPTLHSQLGLAYAGLGRKAEAIQHGQAAVNLLPGSKTGGLGARPLIALAL